MMALSGAHRTGKSTLAKAFVEKHPEFTFVPSRAGEVFKAMGFAVGAPIAPTQRLETQEKILDSFVADIRAVSGPWISDRSPLDMAAYVMSELPGTYSRGDEAIQQRALAYIDRCFLELSRYVPSVMLIQPGIAYVEAEGKPPADLLAQERMNAVLWGLIHDDRTLVRCSFMRRPCVDLKDRVEALSSQYTRIIRDVTEQVEAYGFH